MRTKHIAVKPMTEEEAILQMNLLGHDFFVYRNPSMWSASFIAGRTAAMVCWRPTGSRNKDLDHGAVRRCVI